jgi:hypothetical protein
MDAAGDATALESAIRRPTSVYNAALQGMTLGAIVPWTEAVVEPQLKPEAAVIGLSFGDLNANLPNREATERRFVNSVGMRAVRGDESMLERVERWAGRVSEFVRLRRVLREPVTSLRRGRSNGGKGLDAWRDPALRPDGMSLLFKDASYGTTFGGIPVSREALRTGIRRISLANFQVTHQIESKLRSLVRGLRGRNVRVVLVELPYPQETFDLLPHGKRDADTLTRVVRNTARDEGAAGVAFVRVGIWPLSHFADPLHVNGKGAKRLVREIAPVVSAELDH